MSYEIYGLRGWFFTLIFNPVEAIYMVKQMQQEAKAKEKPRIRVKLSWSGWFIVNERGNQLRTLEGYYEAP